AASVRLRDAAHQRKPEAERARPDVAGAAVERRERVRQRFLAEPRPAIAHLERELRLTRRRLDRESAALDALTVMNRVLEQIVEGASEQRGIRDDADFS